ncbi:MAG: hypothetical protein K5629_01630 [Eubacteriales bacterium]|nr:hypothetical protein [Eubacteriales bacterium]
MKKTISVLFAIIMLVGLTACLTSKTEEKSVFEIIEESKVALMESSDGTRAYVKNRDLQLDLLSYTELEKSPTKPSDKEEDWLYRITYNPKHKVIKGEEVVVSFYSDYLQINSDYYLPKQGSEYYAGILLWAESRFDYLTGYGD